MSRVVHCWYGKRQDIEDRFGYLSDQYIAMHDDGWVDGTCLLLDGHDGPHEFTDDCDIRIRFADHARGGDGGGG